MAEASSLDDYRAEAWRIVLGVSGVVVVADQATKLLARVQLADVPPYRAIEVMPDVAYLYLYDNPVGALGFLSGVPAASRQAVFLTFTVGFCGYILWLVSRARPEQARDLPPLALLLAGFIGNGIDRLWWGSVVDFVVLHLPWTSLAANVADVAIAIGLLWWFRNRWAPAGHEVEA